MGEFLCCPHLGFFWDEVFLEEFWPRVEFERWNRGGGIATDVVAASAIAAFVFCAAAVFLEILAFAVIAVVGGFVGEVDVHFFVLIGGRHVALKKIYQ